MPTSITAIIVITLITVITVITLFIVTVILECYSFIKMPESVGRYIPSLGIGRTAHVGPGRCLTGGTKYLPKGRRPGIYI